MGKETAPMDPDATLDEISEALSSNDFEEAAYLCDSLREWHAKGGYLPSSTGVFLLRILAELARNTDARR